MSGVPFWTFDLGGFKGEPTTEAYVRWVQAGLLLSHSRFHGTTPRIPWYYGDGAFRIVQKYVQLRYRLLPYIYGAALESTKTGLPMIRPLSLEFENDLGSYAVEHQFLLGPSLLVTPVLNPDGKVEMYLPPGVWHDLWTGDKTEGPKLLKLELALDEMPLYVRENAILPTAGPSDTVPDLWDPLTVEVYPRASGRFEIHEEEGRPATVVEVSRSGRLALKARGPERTWRLVLRDVDRPSSVEVTPKGVWEYADKARTLEVKVGPCEIVELRVAS
jgi:alpha-D-xyloside xylohydrolase